MRNSKFKIQKWLLAFCLLPFAFCLNSCSVPNLEEPDCTASRQTLKDFYSYHFGNDMKFSSENLKPREKFLSSSLISTLQTAPATDKDPFTLTEDTPKAFRIGSCKVIEPQKQTTFGVVLFWRKGETNVQHEINVDAVKQDDKWLINKIYENNQK